MLIMLLKPAIVIGTESSWSSHVNVNSDARPWQYNNCSGPAEADIDGVIGKLG
jgi:hypothetical protein